MNSNSEKIDVGPASEFQDNLNILRQIDLFAGIPLEAAKVFAYLSRRETFNRGDRLFQQDENDGDGYYIISGSTRVIYDDGQQTRIIREYQQGDFFGRLSLLGQSRRLFSMEAAVETTCLTISRHKFTKALAQYPELMPKLMNTVAAIIHQWEKQQLSRHKLDDAAGEQIIGVSLV